MTRAQIFSTAHKIAKTLTGNYSACFSYALSFVYKAAKNSIELDKDIDMLAHISKHNNLLFVELLSATTTYAKKVAQISEKHQLLIGSEKQVSWATDIRAKKTASIAFEMTQALFNIVASESKINGTFLVPTNNFWKSAANKVNTEVATSSASQIINKR